MTRKNSAWAIPVLIAALCILIICTAAVAASSKTTSIKPAAATKATPKKTTAKPAPAKPAAPSGPSDRSSEAKELKATEAGTEQWTSTASASFTSAQRVDHWYKYTTHKMTSTGCTQTLTLTLTPDNPQVEIEVYQDSSGWPVQSSLLIYDLKAESGAAWKYSIASTLKKYLSISCKPNHTYYIHVNCLGGPVNKETGKISGTVKYGLSLKELCRESDE
jgi:hypothetical protein